MFLKKNVCFYYSLISGLGIKKNIYIYIFILFFLGYEFLPTPELKLFVVEFLIGIICGGGIFKNYLWWNIYQCQSWNYSWWNF